MTAQDRYPKLVECSKAGVLYLIILNLLSMALDFQR